MRSKGERMAELAAGILTGLVFVILYAPLIIGVLFSVMSSWRMRMTEQERLMARVQDLASTVESTVSVACFLNDTTLAKEIAGGLMKNRILSGVRILSGGKVLYTVGGRAPATRASRGAVDVITKVLANELGPKKIRVNAVNPGMVETEGTHGAGITEGDFRKQVESQTPLGRIGQPGDIGPAVVFFASSDSGWITGETLVIAGGMK